MLSPDSPSPADDGAEFRRRERPVRTSQLLRDFVETVEGERASLGDMVAALGDRGLGVLIAILAVPNIFPSTVPFGNVLTGMPVIFLAVHLMLGWPRLVLPDFLARLSIASASLKFLAPRLAALLSRIERLLKPRLLWVSGPMAERIIGVLCLFLSIISALPIPFGHMLPALGLAIIGLGLIEHDGYAILLGAGLGVGGVLLMGLVLFGLAAGLTHLPF
jgi:hypothetical protein